jgi:hypothetical protein
VSPPNEPESARVELDANTVHRFESFLRDGLVTSGAVSEADNKSLGRDESHVTISLDAKALARFTELLREGLVQSNASVEQDHHALRIMTGRVR